MKFVLVIMVPMLLAQERSYLRDGDLYRSQVLTNTQQLKDHERRITEMENQGRESSRRQHDEEMKIVALVDATESIRTDERLIIGMLVAVLVGFAGRAIYDIWSNGRRARKSSS